MKGFNLSSWGLQHRTLIIFAMLLSLLLGTVAYFKLGRAEDPNLTIKVMTIDVNWPGATTRDLEQQVVEFSVHFKKYLIMIMYKVMYAQDKQPSF